MTFDERNDWRTTETQGLLFALPQGGAMSELDGSAAGDAVAEAVGRPRFKPPNRTQVEYRACCWNDLLPEDHQACIIWDHVKSLDLSPLYGRIMALEGRPGQPPIDPRILMALWLYATLRSVGSARELARRCETDLPFQWICGGVSVNYHTLADFRVAHGEFLNELLTANVAVLLHEDLVTLDRVAQDGMKVRASAGAASFRREPTLEQCLTEARQQVEALRTEIETDPTAANRRQKAARERAARERAERLQKALEQLPLVRQQKSGDEEKKKARVSTTDPEARVMKGPAGAFRPAYNVQLATDTQTQIITGVDAINSGSDQGKLAPMVEQHQERYEETPAAMLVDGGYVKKEDIEQLSPPAGGTVVYAPVMKSKDPNRDPHTPCDDDQPAVAEWRQRMATDEAKAIYKERASTAECVNAIARNRGLYQVRVRGRPKVLAVVLWYVLAHNLMRTVALRAERAEQSG
jgi:transposase